MIHKPALYKPGADCYRVEIEQEYEVGLDDIAHYNIDENRSRPNP
jgi:hypothetical protein